MVTINPNLNENNGSLSYDNIDYYSLSLIADRIIFLNSIWGINYQPPSPISNISLIRPFLDYITDIISPSIISIGKPLIGYDWTLPFTPGSSFARALSLNSVITLAYDQRVVIQLDEESQTPYFNYISSQVGALENHIVWFIDARSINALDDVIAEYNLVGTGLWNLTSFNQQLFSIINARFIITKFSFK
jgi:spore germination protein